MKRPPSPTPSTPRLAVPMHYEMFAFNTETPELFVATATRLGQPYRVLRCGKARDLAQHDHEERVMTITEHITVDTVTEERIAKTIDHSLLKPELTVDDVLGGCEIAARYDVASVCCRPIDVERCRDALVGSNVLVSTVIGFPHGSNLTATKVFEAERAVEQGAVELDMVLQIGLLRSGMVDAVHDDIAAVVAAAGDAAIVKVILENVFLSDEQKVAGCRAAEAAGAAYVKTSTGYAGRRGDARRPRPDEGDGGAAHQGQGRRRRAHAGRPDRLHQRRHRPLRRDRHGGDHRQPARPAGLTSMRSPATQAAGDRSSAGASSLASADGTE